MWRRTANILEVRPWIFAWCPPAHHEASTLVRSNRSSERLDGTEASGSIPRTPIGLSTPTLALGDDGPESEFYRDVKWAFPRESLTLVS